MDDLSKRILTRLVVLGSMLWPLAMLSILFGGYRGTPWSFAISFHIDDGWCNWSAGQGVGTHCFGDFGYPYNLGGSVSPYSPGNGVANATPLMLHIFNMLRLFEYNSGLLVYLALLLAPTVVIAFWVCRLHASPALLFAQLFGGVATIGFLIGFDRGNHVVWVLPLLVLLIVSAEEGNFAQSVVWVVLISLLKWWGPVFVVVLLAKQRLREVLLSIALTAFGHGILLLTYPSLSFGDRISSTLREIFNETYGLHVSQYAVSAKAWIGRTICALGESDCSAVTPGQMLSNSVVTVGISLTILAAVTVIASKLGLKHPYSVMAVCSLTFLPIPEAAAYNLVGASAAVLTLI